MHIHALSRKAVLQVAVILLGAAAPMARLLAQTSDTLTLPHAIELALANAPTLDQAKAVLQASEAHTRLVENASSLRIDGGASYTRIDPVPTVTLPLNGKDVTFGFAPNDNYEAAISIQKVLYDFGAQDARVAATRSLESGAKDNLEQIRTSLAYQTALAYCSLSVIDESVRLQIVQRTILEQSIGIASERERLGAATNLEELNTRVRIAQIESQIADLQDSREKQEAQLRRLMGWGSRDRVLVSSNLSIAESDANADALVEQALTHRPELVVAHDQEASAKLQVESAKASDRPYIAANVQGGVKDGYFPNLTDPKINWAGTVRLAVPLFNGGRSDIQVEEAEANLHAAQSHTLELERSIGLEVQQAMADVRAAKKKLSLVEAQIAQATRALKLTTTRYKNGAATNLEFLTAQSSLEQSETTQVTAKFAYEYSELQLQRALGSRMW